MAAQRQFGMDHPHYDWSPITTRGVLRWPDNARVALCVIVNLEHMEWSTPEGSFQSRSLAGGSVARPFPDYARLSHREYGHRVGVFRVLDVLEKHGIKATVALDAMTAANYPYLVRHLLERGCEIIGHGVSVSRMINSGMSQEQEREYISESLAGHCHRLRAPRLAGTGVRRVGPNAPASSRGRDILHLRLGKRRAALPP